jgi:hypothetical protein
MRIKVRNKYALTVGSMIIFTAFNLFKIPIQDNYLNFMKWALGFICAGFSIKTIAEVFKK